MKKHFLFLTILAVVLISWSCNDNRHGESASGDTAASNLNPPPDSMNAPTNMNPPVSTTPLSKDDSMFVMEAAAGGMMEVEAGRIAQQNAVNQRVKDFGAMMVADHGKAGQDLANIASSHGISLPASLPADKQKHIDEMQKMTGKSFDQHYVSMMVNDHQKDLAKFKKAASGAGSDDLKTWALNVVPVVQKHLDSIQVIRKIKL